MNVCRHRWVDDELGSTQRAYCMYCLIFYDWWLENGEEDE